MPAISLEDLGPRQGVERSFRLARRQYWPTVWVALPSGLLAIFLNVVLGVVPDFLALLVAPAWGWLIVDSTRALCDLLTTSLVATIATLVYLGARFRQEGFDLS